MLKYKDHLVQKFRKRKKKCLQIIKKKKYCDNTKAALIEK